VRVRWPYTPGRLEGAGTPFNWPAAIGYGRAPFANFVSGKGGCTAGPSGVALGIFGWVDPGSGEVSNVQSAGTFLGFVLPVFNLWNWQRVYSVCSPPSPPLLVLRPGIECVVAVAGDFLTRFPQGGEAGSQVWADPATGLPYSSNIGGLVATPWTLMQTGDCNAQLRISSFVRPLN
jgi:hypothetical protein